MRAGLKVVEARESSGVLQGGTIQVLYWGWRDLDGQVRKMGANSMSGTTTPASVERRHHLRLGEPMLLLRFGGQVYAARNWSLGGALIEGGGGLGAGALLTVDALGTDEHDLLETRIPARVVRADPSGGWISVSFLALDDSAYAVLAALMKAVEPLRPLHR